MLDGSALFRRLSQGTAGLALASLALVSAAPHPADTNQDYRVSLAEVTDYANAFAAQTPWPAAPSPIPEAYDRQARFIWQQGERYREIRGAPLPRAWVPAPEEGTVFVALAEVDLRPLDFVEVLGLPEGATNLYAEFQVPPETELYYSGVRERAGGGWELLLPIASGSGDGGGLVVLNLRQDDLTYPVGPIKLAPLPAAPGASAAVAQELELLGTALGDLAGTDLGTYFGMAQSSIPEELRPFVMVDRIVRDPANPNNLAGVLKGAAPLLQEIGGYDPDLTDRIWARTGLAGQLQQLRLGLQQAAPPVALQRAGALRRQERDPATDSVVSIGSLTELSGLMQKQCAAEASGNPNSEAARVKASASYVTSAIGLMGPVGTAFALSANVTLFALDTYQQGEAHVLPSEVLAFELIPSETEFTEDFCTSGFWEAYLSARSKGWSLNKTAVQAVFLAASAGRDIKGLGAARVNDAKAIQLTQDLLDGVDKVVGNAINECFPGDTSVITIAPSTWDNIPVTRGDLGLVTVSYPGDVIQESGGDTVLYEPAKVGSGGLKVETVGGALGCEARKGRTVTVEVRENKITLSPAGGEARPGQEIAFTATITDAYHKELEWVVRGGSLKPGSRVDNPQTGVYTMVWKAPAQSDFPPATLTVRSPTPFCLRQGVERERTATITPQTSQLVLVPKIDCMQREGFQTFTVLDSEHGEVPEGLRWTWIGPGQLSAAGDHADYVAGGEGPVTIRVATADDPPRILEESFYVGECYSLNLSVFEFLPTPGWANNVNGSLSLTDLAGPGEPWNTEGYYVDGRLFLEDSPDRLTGVYSGLGVAVKLPAEAHTDPKNYDDGTRTFTTTAEGVVYELRLHPRIGLQFSDTVFPVAYSGEGLLEVGFLGQSIVRGSWPTRVTIQRHEWSFSDGGQAVGDAVSHLFAVGPRYDQWVRLKVVDSVGHVATTTWNLRFIDFVTQFDTAFDPNGQSNCFAFPLPGAEPDCAALLRVFGPRAGESAMTSVTSAPHPENPDAHSMQFTF